MLRSRVAAALGGAIACWTCFRASALGDDPGATPPRVREEVVVTPNQKAEDPADVAASVVVIPGEVLDRFGPRTLSEVLADVAGMDIGSGSDAGSRVPTPSLWGVKEFGFLLVTLDGVPMGGPFDSNLALVPLTDVSRIEIVKGPQSTLYGLTATAGAIHIFTRRAETEGAARVFAGSFGSLGASFALGGAKGEGWSFKATGSGEKGTGWQDRTDHSGGRLMLTASKAWSEASATLSASLLQVRTAFGSPLPYDGDHPSAGLSPDRNLAVVGARTDHRDYALSGSLSVPVSGDMRLEGTLGLDRDNQIAVRSFLTDTDIDEVIKSAGTSLEPVVETMFADLHLSGIAHVFGDHRWLAGAALTWGETRSDGFAFSYETPMTSSPRIPSLDDVEHDGERSFFDHRSLVGVYLHDEWTPTPRLTIEGGVRWNSASESLRVKGDPEDTPNASSDHRQDTGVSGDASILFRALKSSAGVLDLVSLWASWKTTFKPAAPNLSEAEEATILEPERARSMEVGIKTLWLRRALAVDVSFYRLDLDNQAISVALPGGLPGLTNAGAQRFKGVEVSARAQVPAAPALSAAISYAYHDARFVHFAFRDDHGDLIVVDGKHTELVPRSLWNGLVAFAPKLGPGGFLALRRTGSRFLDRLNRYETGPATEVDAGGTWDFRWGRVSLVARNLGDSRHPVTDSEIGDGQVYVAAPRRVTAEITVHF